MLDKLGLDKKDAEGYRLRTDGGGRLRLALTTYLGFLPFTKIAEMVIEHWKKIGIRGEVQELERGLATARLLANEHQIYFETQWGADNMFGHAPWFFPVDPQSPGRAALRDLVRQRRGEGEDPAARGCGR